MAEEKIRLTAEIDPASLAALDAQLAGVADRFRARLGLPGGGGTAAGAPAAPGAPTGAGTAGALATSARVQGGSGGSSAAAGAALTGQAGGFAGAAGGFAGEVLSGLTGGGGQALRGLPSGMLDSKAAAPFAALGALQGAIEKVPIVGDVAGAYFQNYREQIEAPIRRGADRLAANAGELARYGVNLSDQQLEAGAARVLNQERAALGAERRARKIAGNVGIDTIPSSGAGLSNLGT